MLGDLGTCPSQETFLSFSSSPLWAILNSLIIVNINITMYSYIITV